MQILEVIPLQRGVFRDTLSYFSAKAIPPGAVVTVPLRHKVIPALVLSSVAASVVKSRLRNAEYPVKKIRGVLCERLVRPSFIEAAEKLARWYAAPLGLILPSLLPQPVIESCRHLDSHAFTEDTPPPLRLDGRALQNNDNDRWSTYKSLIREEFARNQSVVLCAPTHLDVLSLAETLGRGIEEYTYVLHGKLTKKEMVKTWNEALAVRRPILLVVTPHFLGLPRADIKIFIIDKESSGAYKSLQRPYVDYRRWCEQLAQTTGSRLIIGDIALRTETLFRLDQGDLQPAESVKQRLVSTALSQIFPAQTGDVINEASYHLINEASAHSEHIFLLATRRGLASLVVCNDCGQAVLCDRCESPIALHARPGSGRAEDDRNFFLCHRCGRERSAKEKCRHCDSWRLHELGTGVERVAEIAQKLFPQNQIMVLTSDTASTSKRARDLVAKFYQSPGAILVGTEMALYYLNEPIHTSVVVSADSLLSLPDFRIHERLFALLVRLRSISSKRFVIQTRYPEEPLFSFAINGNTLGFHRAELAERQSFQYPPFTTLIKITLEGEREATRQNLKKLAAELAPYQPTIYPSFQAIREGRYRLNLLIKLRGDVWPEAELAARLKSLPPSFIVNIDPHDIL